MTENIDWTVVRNHIVHYTGSPEETARIIGIDPNDIMQAMLDGKVTFPDNWDRERTQAKWRNTLRRRQEQNKRNLSDPITRMLAHGAYVYEIQNELDCHWAQVRHHANRLGAPMKHKPKTTQKAQTQTHPQTALPRDYPVWTPDHILPMAARRSETAPRRQWSKMSDKELFGLREEIPPMVLRDRLLSRRKAVCAVTKVPENPNDPSTKLMPVHKDQDKTNNSLDNLMLVSREARLRMRRSSQQNNQQNVDWKQAQRIYDQTHSIGAVKEKLGVSQGELYEANKRKEFLPLPRKNSTFVHHQGMN